MTTKGGGKKGRMLVFGGAGLLKDQTTWYIRKNGKRVFSVKPGDTVPLEDVVNAHSYIKRQLAKVED